jgi:endonuclease/exonuclease/phosphatase family metal-dependent hydrolase
VLSWNLFHGRARESAGRPLAREFATALAGWDWDVAMLQEVPPWWPEPLARAAGAQARRALTSRNELLALRRALARRRPDLLRSEGGGSNAILVRGAILEHREVELTRNPERRVAHGVALADGTWVVNLHASTHPRAQNRADLETAAAAARAWAGDGPLVFGGDVNDTRPRFPGLRHVAGHHVDHLFVHRLEPEGPGTTLDAGALSDHLPLSVALRRCDEPAS